MYTNKQMQKQTKVVSGRNNVKRLLHQLKKVNTSMATNYNVPRKGGGSYQ